MLKSFAEYNAKYAGVTEVLETMALTSQIEPRLLETTVSHAREIMEDMLNKKVDVKHVMMFFSSRKIPFMKNKRQNINVQVGSSRKTIMLPQKTIASKPKVQKAQGRRRGSAGAYRALWAE